MHQFYLFMHSKGKEGKGVSVFRGKEGYSEITINRNAYGESVEALTIKVQAVDGYQCINVLNDKGESVYKTAWQTK